MKIEYEVVFTKIDRDKIINQIKSLGWTCIKENTLMKRIIFHNPLKLEGSYVRVRDEWDKITCTYKETKSWKLDINSVSELETEVWDFNEMVNIFTKLWLKTKSYQEMYREIWKINGEIEFMIDLWPWLKSYIEIEWENENIVKKYSQKLWFNFDDWVFWSVFEVYKKELGLDFETMNSLKEITFSNVPKK